MPATKARFSDKWVESLEAPEQGRAIYYDSESDLALRVTPTHRTFFICGHVRGKSLRKSLGKWDRQGRTVAWARQQAARLLGELANWKLNGQEGPSPFDRVEESASAGMTLKAAIEDYIEKRKLGKWSQHRDPQAAVDQARRWLELCGKLRDRQLDAITAQEVSALFTRITRDRGPVAANRVMQYLSAVFSVILGKDKPNPCRAVERNKERRRTDFLKPEQLVPFLAALEKHANPDFRDFIKLLLYTGRRKSVVYQSSWQDISFVQNTWVIPISKHGDHETVYLSREARAILERRYANREQNNPWVFPSGRTRMSASGHAEFYTDAWYDFMKDAGLADSGLTMHSLRHSYISYVAMSTNSLAVTQQAAGHKNVQSTMRYAHLISGEVQAAVNAGEALRKKLAAKAQKLLSA